MNIETKVNKEIDHLLVQCPFSNEKLDMLELMLFMNQDQGFTDCTGPKQMVELIQLSLDYMAAYMYPGKNDKEMDNSEEYANAVYYLMRLRNAFKTIKVLK